MNFLLGLLQAKTGLPMQGSFLRGMGQKAGLPMDLLDPQQQPQAPGQQPGAPAVRGALSQLMTETAGQGAATGAQPSPMGGLQKAAGAFDATGAGLRPNPAARPQPMGGGGSFSSPGTAAASMLFRQMQKQQGGPQVTPTAGALGGMTMPAPGGPPPFNPGAGMEVTPTQWFGSDIRRDPTSGDDDDPRRGVNDILDEQLKQMRRAYPDLWRMLQQMEQELATGYTDRQEAAMLAPRMETINSHFSQQRGALDADMQARGMGSSSHDAALRAGLAGQEAGARSSAVTQLTDQERERRDQLRAAITQMYAQIATGNMAGAAQLAASLNAVDKSRPRGPLSWLGIG